MGKPRRGGVEIVEVWVCQLEAMFSWKSWTCARLSFLAQWLYASAGSNPGRVEARASRAVSRSGGGALVAGVEAEKHCPPPRQLLLARCSAASTAIHYRGHPRHGARNGACATKCPTARCQPATEVHPCIVAGTPEPPRQGIRAPRRKPETIGIFLSRIPVPFCSMLAMPVVGTSQM